VGFDLEIATALFAGIDGCGGFAVGAGNAGLVGFSEGLEGAGDGDVVSAEDAGEGVLGVEAEAVELEIDVGDVADVGVSFDPAGLEVVEPDDAGVGGGADTEVESAVGVECDVGDAVVALCGEVGDDGLGGRFGVVGEGGDASAAVLVAVGDEDFSAGGDHSADGGVDFKGLGEEGEAFAAGVDFEEGSVLFESEDAGVVVIDAGFGDEE
jgi:hypothetical protein